MSRNHASTSTVAFGLSSSTGLNRCVSRGLRGVVSGVGM